MIRGTSSIVGDIGSLASNGLRAVRTRLELLAIELKEEKAWVVRNLIVASAALYLASFGTLLAILALALSMSEASRPAVLGSLGGLFFSLGIGAAIWLFACSRRRSPALQKTIGVLMRDEKSFGRAGD